MPAPSGQPRHAAAVLDSIGGLLGVREFPATTVSLPLSCRSAARARISAGHPVA